MKDQQTQYPLPSSLEDRLYRAALLVSSSAAAASDLVERTLIQSRVEGSSGSNPELLFKLLWKLAGVEARQRPHTDSAAGKALGKDRVQNALGRARSIVGRTFQELPSDSQTALLFLEVERLPVASVASIMQRSEADIVHLHEHALAAFHDDLFTGAAGWTQEGLLEDLPESWIADSLHHVMQSLGPAPAHLRERVATVSHTDEQSKAVPPVSGPLLDRAPRRDRTGDGFIRSRSIIIAILLILVIGFGARFAYEQLSAPPDSNIITLAARAAEGFAPNLQTDSVDRVRRFLSTHLNDGTPMPLIEGMQLVGVGLEEIAPGVQIVGFKFVDAATDEEVTVYTLSYQFLEHQDRIDLSTDVLRQIQSDSDFDVHNLGKTQVVVWRHRAHIFLAVTELDGRELRPRIYYPSMQGS